ncbi:hypothetical protein HRF19_14390 [Enterococcus faecalis]|nr:hypothetical protein [Enterococcus faecalis]
MINCFYNNSKTNKEKKKLKTLLFFLNICIFSVKKEPGTKITLDFCPRLKN